MTQAESRRSDYTGIVAQHELGFRPTELNPKLSKLNNTSLDKNITQQQSRFAPRKLGRGRSGRTIRRKNTRTCPESEARTERKPCVVYTLDRDSLGSHKKARQGKTGLIYGFFFYQRAGPGSTAAAVLLRKTSGQKSPDLWIVHQQSGRYKECLDFSVGEGGE